MSAERPKSILNASEPDIFEKETKSQEPKSAINMSKRPLSIKEKSAKVSNISKWSENESEKSKLSEKKDFVFPRKSAIEEKKSEKRIFPTEISVKKEKSVQKQLSQLSKWSDEESASSNRLSRQSRMSRISRISQWSDNDSERSESNKSARR